MVMPASATSKMNMESSSDQNIARKDQDLIKKATGPPLRATRSNGMSRGLLLALLCGVLYSLCGVIVKFLRNIHPAQIVMYRSVAITALSLPEAVKTQENLLGPRKSRFFLFLRVIFGTTNIFLQFLAYRFLPLGEAAVIMHTSPVFVSIAAKIMLKERCGIVQAVIVSITVIGIIFILRVPAMLSGSSFNYTAKYSYGLVAAFSSLITVTGLVIVLRKLAGVHHSIIMLHFGWFGFIGSSVLTATAGYFGLPMCGLQQCLVILVGILSHGAVTLFTMALQLENAGPVSVVRSASEVIGCFLWQIFFFRDYPDDFSIVGAVILGLSIILAGLCKWVSSLPPHSVAAKYLKFLSF